MDPYNKLLSCNKIIHLNQNAYILKTAYTVEFKGVMFTFFDDLLHM